MKSISLLPLSILRNSKYFKKREDGRWTVAEKQDQDAQEKDLLDIDLGLLVKPQITYVR